MGQIQMMMRDNEYNSPRVPYEENGDNGFIICDKYIPEELISEILCYVDYKSLLNCQLVCKRWKNLLYDYVWRKKTEIVIGHSLQLTKIYPWNVYYNICKKKPFDRNLLKNNSGQNNLLHWAIESQGGDDWKVECPPAGVPPLPDNPIFGGKNCCFVTSYRTCTKRQKINLIDEGLAQVLLDTLQPSILVGEWYSGRWDCPSVYECSVSLIGNDDVILDTYEFYKAIHGDDMQNLWHHFEHEFTSYGPGLKEIIFEHSGCDSLFWAGHYGSKMAGASIIVKLKSNKSCMNVLENVAPENSL